MIKWKVWVAIISGLSLICPGICEPIKRSEYNKMPKLFQYEYYDDCLFADPEVEATYCMVRAVIKPDNGSELWRLIEEFSSKRKLHLNHAALDRGICIGDVKEMMDKYRGVNVSELVVPKFDINFPYKIKHDAFKNTAAYIQNYSEIASIIINKDLSEKHGLKAYTEIEYCDRTGVDEFPIDNLDIAFVVIMAVLIILVFLSSWYDYQCKVGFGLNHYREDLPTQKSMLLASFSVIRNWYRLTVRAREPLNRDLRVIQAVRYHTFTLTLIGHASILVQPRTGWVLEQKYRELQTMIIVNGFQIVSTFIGISGLVFTIMFIHKMQELGKKPGWLTIITVTVNRYIRLSPVYALVLLFKTTWFIRLQDGPFWRRGVETERTFCRRNWWINLLYFNNYYKLEEPCMQHSWFLASDFQLSIIGLIVVTAVVRFPKIKVFLLAMVTGISVFIPAVVVYKNGLDGVTIFSPEARRFIFWYDEVYHKTYLPTHMNLIIYMFGIITGLLYFQFKKSNCNFGTHWLFRITWYSLFLLGPGLFLTGRIFYVNDFPKPSLWMSIYFAAARVLWALIIVVGFFGFVYRVNKPVTRLLSIRFFEILGRLTYGAYVVHFFIIKMMFYNVRELSNLSVFDISTKLHGTLYLSLILSLAMALLVELPISAIQKQLLAGLMKQKRRGSHNHVVPEENANGKKNTPTNNGGYANDAFSSSFKENVELQQRL
ncbi:nose resistant to fluoxetine protein 6-like [Ochlerotatus camptorhynchus]|uniref:nose resistant to fluoxetine protein 6-like n=1 Tax=Ochlerotatus camptorhynchus TaxID=644619 RepID=UPI0031CFC208